jgi:hypothetical protein
MKLTEEQKTHLRTKIGTSVGHASMCWNPRPGDIVFDSTEAKKVWEDLYEYVINMVEQPVIS